MLDDLLTIIATALMIILSGVLIIFGLKLRQGKWLRLIAGNTFNDLPTTQAQKIGKLTGLILYGSALLCLIISFIILYKTKLTSLIILSITLSLLVGFMVIFSIRKDIKIKKQKKLPRS